jgi:hypothetical protein
MLCLVCFECVGLCVGCVGFCVDLKKCVGLCVGCVGFCVDLKKCVGLCVGCVAFCVDPKLDTLFDCCLLFRFSIAFCTSHNPLVIVTTTRDENCTLLLFCC